MNVGNGLDCSDGVLGGRGVNVASVRDLSGWHTFFCFGTRSATNCGHKQQGVWGPGEGLL